MYTGVNYFKIFFPHWTSSVNPLALIGVIADPITVPKFTF